MEELLRQELIDKLTAMRKLGEAVRKTAGLAAIESCMRFVDANCVSALWNLGAIDFWEYELEYPIVPPSK
ncbi:MAG: hypothetical protein Q8P24_14020 [Desulfobacterales bacterium]|nr:hypothetical protein [Desulfobacterales bacterium]